MTILRKSIVAHIIFLSKESIRFLSLIVSHTFLPNLHE